MVVSLQKFTDCCWAVYDPFHEIQQHSIYVDGIQLFDRRPASECCTGYDIFLVFLATMMILRK